VGEREGGPPYGGAYLYGRCDGEEDSEGLGREISERGSCQPIEEDGE